MRGERWGPKLLLSGFAVLAPASFVGGTSHFIISSLPYRTVPPSPPDLQLLGIGMAVGTVAILVGAMLVALGWVLMLGSSENKMIFHTVIIMVCIVGGWLWAAGFFAGSAVPVHGATVNMKSTIYTGTYQPAALAVIIGVNNTVTWINDRSNSHPDAVMSADGKIYSGILAPGDRWSYTFTSPGAYRFHSPIHLGMGGTVIVKEG